MKIYVHHYFSNSLFYKLAHNTTDREYDIKGKIGEIKCKYNNNEFTFVFNPILHDAEDGYHLIDFFTSLRNKNEYEYYRDIDITSGVEDLPFFKRFVELLKDKKGWILTLFRTEKLFGIRDVNWSPDICEIENVLSCLNQHILITDNVFIHNANEYKNVFTTFTNTIFQWNELIGIRWYYEFNEIYKKLNFDYDLMYSVRNHKLHRVNALKELYKLNIPNLLLQRTNGINRITYSTPYESDVKDIKLNSVLGNNDFENLTWISWFDGIGMDLFYRVLPKAKMQVLDESWAWCKQDFTSQYLSEKTVGLILAGIPFISTHSYPLEVLEKLIGIRSHPFMTDFKLIKGDYKLFVKFVEKFMNDFENNYILCKEWMDECRDIFIKKITYENSMLDIFNKNFENEIELKLI